MVDSLCMLNVIFACRPQHEVLILAQDSIIVDRAAEDDDHGSESEPSEWSFASMNKEQESQTTDRDIMMVVLLSLSLILC